MKRELGFGRCGLACCLCSENDVCAGCDSGSCPDKDRCENRRCSAEKGLGGCFACAEVLQCTKGLLQKVKPRAFTLFIRRRGKEALLDVLEQNESRGVVYHRSGVNGDYDAFETPQQLLCFLGDGPP